MTNLTVRDSLFQDLFDFRRDFEQFFNRFFNTWSASAPQEGAQAPMFSFTPALEAWVDTEARQFHCRVALPGVDPAHVNIQVQGNTLTISGERRMNREQPNINYLYSEVVYGSFSRTLTLPEGVQTDQLSAEYHNGVLELTAPVASAALPRRIEIRGALQSKKAAA